MKFKGLTSLVLGTSLALVGCDNIGDLVLDETEIKGPVNIKLKQEIQIGDDSYRLEVYDEENNLRATLKTNYLRDGTKLVHDSGKAYTVKDGNRFYEPEKDFKEAMNKKKLILKINSDY